MLRFAQITTTLDLLQTYLLPLSHVPSPPAPAAPMPRRHHPCAAVGHHATTHGRTATTAPQATAMPMLATARGHARRRLPPRALCHYGSARGPQRRCRGMHPMSVHCLPVAVVPGEATTFCNFNFNIFCFQVHHIFLQFQYVFSRFSMFSHFYFNISSKKESLHGIF